VRLFVACGIPPELRGRLQRLQTDLRSIALEIRWVRIEGIHLTFKFLGEVEPERVASIEEALRIAAGPCPPFTLAAGGVGVFPERGEPKVLWVGIGGDLTEAARLQQSIETQLHPLGFAPEKRPFTPHLTLGRIKGKRGGGWRVDLERHGGEGSLGSFEVGECALIESRLDGSGATYSTLGRFPLSGARGRS
jgi:RNA 2',3'-cyclic 3'-phosphodiesterase